MKQPRSAGPGRLALLAGIASALLSALVTSGMLLINGSMTLVVIRSLAGDQEQKGLIQFALFVIPVVLSVGQWIALDVAIGILRKSKLESDSKRWNST